MPSSAWYNRYYEISEEEYNEFDVNHDKMDAFVDKLHIKSYDSDRFLFSDKSNENSESQSRLKELSRK